MSYVGRGNLDEAIKSYNEAIRLKPRVRAAYHNRGSAYADKGDSDRAITDFSESRYPASSRSTRGVSESGDSLLETSTTSTKALADCEDAVRLDPKAAETYDTRASAYAGEGKLDKAITDYDKAIRLDPKNPRRTTTVVSLMCAWATSIRPLPTTAIRSGSTRNVR